MKHVLALFILASASALAQVWEYAEMSYHYYARTASGEPFVVLHLDLPDRTYHEEGNIEVVRDAYIAHFDLQPEQAAYTFALLNHLGSLRWEIINVTRQETEQRFSLHYTFKRARWAGGGG